MTKQEWVNERIERWSPYDHKMKTVFKESKINHLMSNYQIAFLQWFSSPNDTYARKRCIKFIESEGWNDFIETLQFINNSKYMTIRDELVLMAREINNPQYCPKTEIPKDMYIHFMGGFIPVYSALWEEVIN